jgi:pyrroloquinoline quinone (PQQ) biosynthesis protein C
MWDKVLTRVLRRTDVVPQLDDVSVRVYMSFSKPSFLRGRRGRLTRKKAGTMRASAARNTRHTVADRAAEKLSRLASRLELPSAAADAMIGLMHGLVGPLGELIPDSSPLWPSNISDDGSPIELSVVLDAEQPEVRVLWESQPLSPDFSGRIRAGLETQRRLCEVFGASNDRLERVKSLFLPEDGVGAFAVWHAARIWPAKSSPDIKVYLNPQVRGRLAAAALVEEALGRLGLQNAWRSVMAAMPRGPEQDELRYFSLDLSDEPSARVKVYVYHHEPTSDVLRAAAGAVPKADPARLVDFFGKISAGNQGAGMSPATCLSFLPDEPEPTAATLHVPVRTYVERDGEVAARVQTAVGELAARVHAASVEAMRDRPLDEGVGLTTYLSLRSPDSRVRATAYLATETYATTKPRAPKQPVPAPEPIERMVEFYEQQPLSLHPFFQRSSREVVNVQHMWLMFHNIYGGLSQHFPRRLAHVITGIEDDAIRSMLAEQLHEELGGGDYTRAHRRLFLKLLEALAPWRPSVVVPEMNRPAERLSKSLEAAYFDARPYAGVGASIVIELLGKQVDIFVANQFRRQQAVGMASLEWLTLHETLELDHADESMKMAQRIQEPADRAAAWFGGRAVHAAGWAFFDDMYELCFAR